MQEILINGHSGHESTGFSLPNGVSITFYADPRTTCYVPPIHVSNVVQQLRNGGGHLMQPGNLVNDYMIQFDSNDPTEGVFDMHERRLPGVGSAISLRNLIQRLRQLFPTDNIMIYGIFCRGSAREGFAGQVEPVSPRYGQQSLLDEKPLYFDMGGNRKRKPKRKPKRKTKKTKRKTKRKTKKTKKKTKRRVKKRKRTKRR